MNQLDLVPAPIAPARAGIDIRHCSVADLLPLTGDLAIVDAPWKYEQRAGESAADDHYEGLPIPTIVDHLSQIDTPRLVVWITWPILAADWPERLPTWGRPVTGGAWFKSAPDDMGHYGQGYHWAGCSEPVLVYTRSTAYNDRSAPLRNAWHEAPGAHSRKPVEWQAQMIRRWCPPGGRVVDPYVGLASSAEALLYAGRGRTFLGAEIDAGRHRDAMGLIAQWRGGE